MSRLQTVKPTAIELLHALFPPATLIHVGVGMGVGAMHQWHEWDVPQAWLIDADAAHLGWAKHLAEGKSGWTVLDAIIADANGEAEFFRASNPAESSLVATGKLAVFWPNIRLAEQLTRPVSRLDTLLEQYPQPPDTDDGAAAWLIVDCLPALRILKGAAATLDRCSVLWLRAVLQSMPGEEPDVTLDALASYLHPLGFRCIQIVEGNHPAIGEVLFVRDWSERFRSVVAVLTCKNTILEKEATRLAVHRDAMLEEVARLTIISDNTVEVSQLQAQIATLIEDKVTLVAENESIVRDRAAQVIRYGELQSEVNVLVTARSEQLELIGNWQAQVLQVSQARDENAQIANLCQVQVEAKNQEIATLHDENANLVHDRSALAVRYGELQSEFNVLADECNKQTQIANQRQVQVDALLQDKSGLLDQQNGLYGKLAVLAAAHDQQDRLVADQQAQIQALALAREEQTQIATRCQSQLDIVSQENAKLGEDIAALVAARDEQIQLSSAYQSQLDIARQENTQLAANIAAFAAARDEQTALAADRQAHIEQMIQAQNLVSATTQNLEAGIKEKDAHLAKLTAELTEMAYRQLQLTEEIVRAEAQIDLIKDVLLREPRL
jgi:hypothetical protein